jgi:hypothetical protein
MNFDNFSDLPDWDEGRFIFEDEEGEEWKPNPTRNACKTLYKQWQHVMFLLKGILVPIIEKEENSIEASMDIDTARDLHGDAYVVGAKIRSSEGGGIYSIRMENAAIIRQLAQGIATGLLSFVDDKSADKDYINVVRSEIDKFRALFIEWVNTFEKDEFKDSWGLFV